MNKTREPLTVDESNFRRRALNTISILAASVMGAYVVFGPFGTEETAKNRDPQIEPGEPALVVESDRTQTGGSKLVLRQCVDAPEGCVRETYVSKYPDPALVYQENETMRPLEVIPPLKFVPEK